MKEIRMAIHRRIDIKIKLRIYACDRPSDIRYETGFNNYHIEQTKPEFDTSLVIWRDRAETLIYKSIERRVKERFPWVDHGTYCWTLYYQLPFVEEIEKVEVAPPIIPTDVRRRLEYLELLKLAAETTKGPKWEEEVKAYERAIARIKELYGIIL